MARTPPPRMVDRGHNSRAYREWLVTHVVEDVDPASGAWGWWLGYDMGHMQEFVPRADHGVVPAIGSTLRLYETPTDPPRVDGVMIDGTMIMWDGRPVGGVRVIVTDPAVSLTGSVARVEAGSAGFAAG